MKFEAQEISTMINFLKAFLNNFVRSIKNHQSVIEKLHQGNSKNVARFDSLKKFTASILKLTLINFRYENKLLFSMGNFSSSKKQ